MELRHLRYFVMAAEELNISHAAARLNVSQPAVSRQIHDLEEELGVSLFQRERIGLSLTPAGRGALVHAKAILRQAAGLGDAMRPFRDAAKGVTLKVGYLPTALPVFLADGLLRFNRAHKNVCVEISEMTPTVQEAALRSGEVDLALPGQPWAALKQEFEVVILHKTPIGVALPEGHRLAGRKSLDLRELETERFVSLSEKFFPTRPQMMTELFGKAGYEPEVVRKAKGLSEMLGMVATGFGIALVPLELNHIAHSRVVFAKLRRPALSLSFSAVWKKGRSDSHVSELVSFLKQG